MEKLKDVVAEGLKRRIGESTPDQLLSTSTSLLEFFHSLPLFHQIVGDLTDPERALCVKDMKAAMELKLKGNECFAKGDNMAAVRFYSQALRIAPAKSDTISNNPVALLYGNRASAFYKMGLLVECLRDSTRALSIFPAYAKAWFRRGKAYASLGHYEDAIRSWNIASKLETSLSGKKQIETEVAMVINKPKGATDHLLHKNGRKSDSVDEPCQVELQSIVTRTKGRGMISVSCIPEASLIHKEDPYATIIFKHCRDTHCHFCFGELPLDVVPCPWCSISLYCSVQCQVQAGGQMSMDYPRNISVYENLPDDLAKYVSDFCSHSISDSCKGFTEHSHECQGVHWPFILPSDIVLVGRVLAKHIKQQRTSGSGFDFRGIWDLCHNYAELPPETKLEFHIYAIILLQCLQCSYGSELPVNGKTVSEIIILLSQIRVNAMAIVRFKSSNLRSLESCGAEYTSTASVEQVKVGQAVYSVGSLFNHSCLPNIHSYFSSRTLYIRATEFVEAGSHLELSYGPQVGQSDSIERRKLLESRYSFWCECRGCTQPNLSDLVFDAYKCVNPNCFGVVLNMDALKHEKQKFHSFLGGPSGGKLIGSEIETVVSMCDNLVNRKPGHCLKCQYPIDMEASRVRIGEADTYFTRLQGAVASNDVQGSTLLEALQRVDLLRQILHPYNKRIAEAEDTLAQAFCLVGEFQAALDHCLKSVQVLVKLYDPYHIAIGNEKIKISSMQLSLRDAAAVSDSLNEATSIFLRYYGSHTNEIFPVIQLLSNEALKLGL